jgi:hypothetical protein
MRKDLVYDHLKGVEQQLLRCEAFLNSVRANIRTLENNGRDASEAKQLLVSYVNSRARLTALRDRLQTELAGLELSASPAE